MVYKYTAEQERVYRETGRRPRTSQLKRYTGKKTTQPTITTADGRVITEEQQRKEIIASVQKNYLDRNVSPPPELIRTLGLKVVTTTTKPTEPATQPAPKPVVKIATPHPHLTQTEQLVLAKNYQDFLQNKGVYANGQKYIISQGVHGPMKIRVDSDLTETRAVRTVIPQTYRILNKPISEVTKKYVKPSLTDYYYEGVKYGRKHPNIAKVASAGTKVQPAFVKQTLDPTSKNPNIVAKSIRAFSNGALAGVREDPLKVGLFLAIPAAFNTAAKGARLLPVTRAFVQSEKAMKLTAGAMGAVYTADVYTRVTAPVVGSWSSSTKEERTKLKSGDIQVKTITTETPVYRKPTSDEMAYRLGGIFSTEVGPMAFGAMGLRRPARSKLNELNVKAKPRTTSKIKIIKEAPAKVKPFAQKKIRSAKNKIQNIESNIDQIRKTRTRIVKQINRLSPKQRTFAKKQLKLLDQRFKWVNKQSKLVSKWKKDVADYETFLARRRPKPVTKRGLKKYRREKEFESRERRLKKEWDREIERIKEQRFDDELTRFKEFEKYSKSLAGRVGQAKEFIEFTQSSYGKPLSKPQKIKGGYIESVGDSGKTITRITKSIQKVKKPPKPKSATTIETEVDVGNGMVMVQELKVKVKTQTAEMTKTKQKLKMAEQELKKATTTKQVNKVKNVLESQSTKISNQSAKLKQAYGTAVRVGSLMVALYRQPAISVAQKQKIKTVIIAAQKVKNDVKQLQKTLLKETTKLKMAQKVAVKQKVAQKTKQKTKLKSAQKLKPKQKIRQAEVIVKLPRRTKKSISKKRKRKIKSGMKEFSIKNPVPTLEDVL